MLFCKASPRQLKGNRVSLIYWEKGALIEENLDWIFVNHVPMLCDKLRIAKQQKIETWLNLHQIVTKLGLQKKETHESTAPVKYVV